MFLARYSSAIAFCLCGALVRAQNAAKPVPTDTTRALQETLAELAETGLSGAVFVARGDEILLDTACGLADRAGGRLNRSDTIFDIGSITKQFTATAILRLEEQQKLSTDDTLDRFFDGVPADKRRIRLHHLLTHTSGLPRDVPVGSATATVDALVNACMQAKLQSEPGKEFVYANAGYMLLAATIERVSGQSYEAYVAEHLFRAAGMTSSGFLRTDGVDVTRTAHGYEGRKAFGPAERGWYSWGLRGAGGILSTTGDLARWCRALDIRSVLSEQSCKKQLTPFLVNYGYGWFVESDPVLGTTIRHGGTTRGFEASLARFVEKDLRVIVLCNDRGACTAAAQRLALTAIGAREDGGNAWLSDEELAPFAGEYRTSAGRVRVSIENGALVVEPSAEAVVGIVNGRAKPSKNAKLDARAKKVCELLAAGDADAAQELMSRQWPGWNRQMIGVWSRWIDERGKLDKIVPLGSKGEEQTLVQLVHEHRSVVWTLYWHGGLLNGWSVDGGIPEGAQYRAIGGSTFAFEDPETNKRFSLAFDRTTDGRVRGLALTGPATKLEAARAD